MSGEVRIVERVRGVRRPVLAELLRKLGWVTCPLPRLRRRGADGDVVRVAIATIGTEREDGCRPEVADQMRQLADEGLAG